MVGYPVKGWVGVGRGPAGRDRQRVGGYGSGADLIPQLALGAARARAMRRAATRSAGMRIGRCEALNERSVREH